MVDSRVAWHWGADLLGPGRQSFLSSWLSSPLLFVLLVLAQSFVVPRLRVKLLRLTLTVELFRLASFLLLFFCSHVAQQAASLYRYSGGGGSDEEIRGSSTLIVFLLLKYVVLTHRTVFVGQKRLLYLETFVWLLTLRYDTHVSVFFAVMLDCVRIGIMLIPSASGFDSAAYCNFLSWFTRQLDFVFCLSSIAHGGHYPILLLATLVYSAPLHHALTMGLTLLFPSWFLVFWVMSVVLQVVAHRRKKLPSWRRRSYRSAVDPALKFSAEEVDKLIDIFWSLDKDRNDKVDAGELAIAIGSTRQVALDYISEIDLDSSGDLDFNEFLLLARRIRDNCQAGAFGLMLQKSGVFDFLFESSLLRSSSEEISDDLSSSMDTEVVVWCAACCKERACIQMLPCTHLALCESCDAEDQKNSLRHCVICRGHISGATQVYF